MLYNFIKNPIKIIAVDFASFCLIKYTKDKMMVAAIIPLLCKLDAEFIISLADNIKMKFWYLGKIGNCLIAKKSKPASKMPHTNVAKVVGNKEKGITNTAKLGL